MTHAHAGVSSDRQHQAARDHPQVAEYEAILPPLPSTATDRIERTECRIMKCASHTHKIDPASGPGPPLRGAHAPGLIHPRPYRQTAPLRSWRCHGRGYPRVTGKCCISGICTDTHRRRQTRRLRDCANKSSIHGMHAPLLVSRNAAPGHISRIHSWSSLLTNHDTTQQADASNQLAAADPAGGSILQHSACSDHRKS